MWVNETLDFDMLFLQIIFTWKNPSNSDGSRCDTSSTWDKETIHRSSESCGNILHKVTFFLCSWLPVWMCMQLATGQQLAFRNADRFGHVYFALNCKIYVEHKQQFVFV